MIATTEVPENHVVEELLRGYKLRDRLLRPAMVLVAKKPGKLNSAALPRKEEDSGYYQFKRDYYEVLEITRTAERSGD